MQSESEKNVEYVFSPRLPKSVLTIVLDHVPDASTELLTNSIIFVPVPKTTTGIVPTLPIFNTL